MNEEKEQSPETSEGIWCRRFERKRPLSEHQHCPYCFGREGEIIAGKHQAFCDYRPGVDPLHFGFPEGTSRQEQG